MILNISKITNANVTQVEQSYERLATSEKLKRLDIANSVGGDFVLEDDTETESPAAEPDMLVDPSSNVPLKVYALPEENLGKFYTDKDWVPPVKLTKEEEAIVKRPSKDGALLLLGRSGTGKTCCVTSRMAHDRYLALCGPNPKPLRQLFIARNKSLIEAVEAVQKNTGEDLSDARFAKPERLMDEVLGQLLAEAQETGEELDVDPRLSQALKYVDFDKFKKMWKDIGGERQQHLDSLKVWTQIRSFIKGSYEAAKAGRPLLLEEYQAISGTKRCRLDADTRAKAYVIFEKYQAWLDEKGQWVHIIFTHPHI
jgi:hypothetical protein